MLRPRPARGWNLCAASPINKLLLEKYEVACLDERGNDL